MRAAVALALLTACTSLPAFDEGTCGNLVLDPGESCDEASEICDAQCRLLCGDLDPGASCGGGFVCGIDGVCQAPGGSFGEVTARLPLDPVALTVTDLDSDHIGDLLAVSATTISVTFGDVGGVLHDQTQTIAPVFRGAPAFGHLDGDGRADVLLATPDGIVGYSSAHGVIAPHPFALDLGQTTPASCAVGQPFAVFSIDEQFLGVLYLAPNGTDLGLAAIDSAGRTSCPTQRKSLCTVPPGSNPSRSRPMSTTRAQAGCPRAWWRSPHRPARASRTSCARRWRPSRSRWPVRTCLGSQGGRSSQTSSAMAARR